MDIIIKIIVFISFRKGGNRKRKKIRENHKYIKGSFIMRFLIMKEMKMMNVV